MAQLAIHTQYSLGDAGKVGGLLLLTCLALRAAGQGLKGKLGLRPKAEKRRGNDENYPHFSHFSHCVN